MSRNSGGDPEFTAGEVTLREERVSRNDANGNQIGSLNVTLREERVSRNQKSQRSFGAYQRHAPRGACE